MSDSGRSGRRWLALAVFGGVVAVAAGWGARYSPAEGHIRTWYASLNKPPYNPPDAVFAPVWTLLYCLMAWSAWRVYRRPVSSARTLAIVLWFTQLALNAVWSRIFFGSQDPKLAMVDIGALFAAIVAYTVVTSKVDRPASWAMVPYLGWVAFAAVLNGEIILRNP